MRQQREADPLLQGIHKQDASPHALIGRICSCPILLGHYLELTTSALGRADTLRAESQLSIRQRLPERAIPGQCNLIIK